ncbi:MAG: site-specific integrase [Oscillibacter sp.]|nr:site-specific integrase [Oscillibacter sp.]
MARKAAAGTGNIRKKTVKRNGKEYTYWEARYTAGYDPGTGKQIQRSITGKTQKEVAQKLKEVTHEIDEGKYVPPNRMTVGQWMDTWAENYLGNVKPSTSFTYKQHIRLYIKPALGAVKLSELQPYTVQQFINGMSDHAPGTATLAYRVLHMALEKAVRLDYIVKNPANYCELPKPTKMDMQILDIPVFLETIKGNPYEALFKVTLFTGMRQGEVLGLMWSCVDFQKGTILIDKQLRFEEHQYVFHSPKSGKNRTITPAPWVMKILRQVQSRQAELRLKAGPLWEDSGLVFTNDLGGHLAANTVRDNFKRCMIAIGMPKARFHDLRHNYAVSSIQAGDDIKTIQENMGHGNAALTLNIYAHVTEQMRQGSADRMEAYIQKLLAK